MGLGIALPEDRTQRMLAVATFINTFGSGMYMSVMVMFFTRSVKLSGDQVGVGLTIAGVAGLAAGAPVGHLSDRLGPRVVYVWMSVIATVGMAAFVLVHSFLPFVVIAVLVSLGQIGGRAARGGMTARIGGDKRVVFRAYLRSVTNIGIALGGLFGGLALVFDTRTWYVSLLLINALTFLVDGLITARLPKMEPLPVPAGTGRWLALRDRRFMAMTSVHSLLAIQFEVLMFAVPLWISKHAHTPRWTVSVVLLVNTVLVASLQVRASRSVDSVARGVAVTRRSGWIFAASALVFAATGSVPAWASVLLLMSGAAIHSVGEILQQAGAFQLSYDLAAEHAQGQYQGVFVMGYGAAVAMAPALLSFLCVGLGVAGWAILAGMFIALGSLISVVVRVGGTGIEAVETQAAVV